MKIGQTHNDCRYWGYEPLSYSYVARQTSAERVARREQMKVDKDKIKASGNKVSAYGVKSKEACITTAQLIEKITGVEMHVFNHDYL